MRASAGKRTEGREGGMEKGEVGAGRGPRTGELGQLLRGELQAAHERRGGVGLLRCGEVLSVGCARGVGDRPAGADVTERGLLFAGAGGAGPPGGAAGA